MPESSVSPSFNWLLGQGPDPEALGRLAKAFAKPKEPMGEAWFMGEERELYSELLGDLSTLADEQLRKPLEEIACGTSSFGPMSEWIDWYHYLLPRLLVRDWDWHLFHPVELLVTGFIGQHPISAGSQPYPAFHADALATLGQYIMSPSFWQVSDSEVPKCLNKWRGPNGISGWYRVDGLMSASLFYCLKYLPADLVGPWFQSALSIPNKYWRAQMITWLVGAHPILITEIGQPAELRDDVHFEVGWEWSHCLDGHYTGIYEPPIHLATFLPAENCQAVLEIARTRETLELCVDVLTDPELEPVFAETAGLPDYFQNLYGADALNG